MAKWSSSKKHLPSEINSGNQYEIKDRLVLEQLNAITENSFYASEKVDTVISDAQNVVNQGKTEIENTTSQGKNELNSIVDNAEDLVAKANASINTVVGTANEALFTVQQVVASKGYYGSNPNLLINGDFRVNQRGQTSYSGTNIYTVDRWRLTGTGVVDVLANGIRFTAGGGWTGIRYFFEKPSQLANKTITISAKVTGSVGVWCGFLLNGTNVGGGYNEIKTSQIFKATLTFGEISDNDTLFVRFTTRAPGDTLEFEWIKVEIGSVATEFSPRPYAEELAMCQRYYVKMPSNTIFAGRGNSTNVCSFMIPLPVTQRSAGSINISNLIVSAGNTSYETNTVRVQSMENTSVGKNVMIETDLNTMAYRNAYNMYSTAVIELDAEIY